MGRRQSAKGQSPRTIRIDKLARRWAQKVETKDIRRTAVRERVFEVLDRIQGRTKEVSREEIRRVIRDSIEAVRRPARRAGA